MNYVSVDFSKKTGIVKPLHSVCQAPYNLRLGDEQKSIDKFFKEAKIPYCRLHDCCGSWGGTHFVDIPNVFPDFDADENDPTSYDFHYTDEYIGAIQKSGCEAYYRLGVTIEWGSKKYASLPPKDFNKWARICEHVIMHYNEGWADGFHYNLKYWEIWNEPENPGTIQNGASQWGGTKEEFFELYKISSKYLKNRFPEIKIGGYGGCGFYGVTKAKDDPVRVGFVTYFTDFLEMVKKEACPLDFYSWHIYTPDEKDLLAHAKYVRETLDQNGFCDTESHLNEWNLNSEGTGHREKHTLKGASFLAASLAMMQNTNYVDMAHYYCFSGRSPYDGFLDQNDSTICPSWYPYVAFGKLYGLENSVDSTTGGEIYATAATDDNEYGVMISNYLSDDGETEISLKGINGKKLMRVLFIKENYNLDEEYSVTVSGDTTLKIRLPKQTVAYLEIK